jgi:hypothetical protein
MVSLLIEQMTNLEFVPHINEPNLNDLMFGVKFDLGLS